MVSWCKHHQCSGHNYSQRKRKRNQHIMHKMSNVIMRTNQQTLGRRNHWTLPYGNKLHPKSLMNPSSWMHCSRMLCLRMGMKSPVVGGIKAGPSIQDPSILRQYLVSSTSSQAILPATILLP